MLSHEADSLAGDLHQHVSGKKRNIQSSPERFSASCRQQQPEKRRVDLTAATYALFGMMNWIYNWYDPNGKLKVAELVEHVTRLFLHGFVDGLAPEELNSTLSPRQSR